MGATLLHDFFMFVVICLQARVWEKEPLACTSCRHPSSCGDTPLSAQHDLHEICGLQSLLFHSWKGGFEKKMLFFIFCFLYLGSVTVFISEIKAMKWTKCTLRRRQLKWLSGRLHAGTRFLQNFGLWRKKTWINTKSHFLFPFFIFFSPVSVHWSPCAVFLLR